MAYNDIKRPKSDCFDSIAFEAERKGMRGIMGVKFKDGSEYYYDDFSYNEWKRFARSGSKGRYYNKNIREE